MHHNHRQYTRIVDCIPPYSIQFTIHNPHFSQPTVDGRRIVYISVPMQSTVIHVCTMYKCLKRSKSNSNSNNVILYHRFRLKNEFSTYKIRIAACFGCAANDEKLNWRICKLNRRWNEWKRLAEHGLEKMHNECVVRWSGWMLASWQFWVTRDDRHLNVFSSIGIHCK